MNCNCEKALASCDCLVAENVAETVETAEIIEAEVISTGIDTVLNDFSSWINDLETDEQPTCNIENPEDCENCGS